MRLFALIKEAAWWIPPRIWTYAAEDLPSGDFTGFSAEDIAGLVAYRGDAQKMLTALQETGFFDGMKIHGWADRSRYHESLRLRAQKAAAARWGSNGHTAEPELALDGADQPQPAPANSKLLPTCTEAIRISKLFRRRLTTPWEEKEIKTFKRLMPIASADLDMLERYYAAERAKPNDKGIHRRDLPTFLNNFAGEIDRARIAGFDKAHSKAGENPEGWKEFLADFEAGKYSAETRPYSKVESFIRTDFATWKRGRK